MRNKHALQKAELMAKDRSRADWLKSHDENVLSMKHTDSLLKAGVVAMLHHAIYENCTTYLDRGYISTGELNDLEYLFESYHDLGGNGTGEVLYNKCKNLQIKEDEHFE